jgi:hypothetical protein
MFVTKEEAAELAYERIRLAYLEPNYTESYSGSDYDVTDSTLIKHPTLAKLRSLAVILRDNKFDQAFKRLAKGFL